jgi:hypothetical protein
MPAVELVWVQTAGSDGEMNAAHADAHAGLALKQLETDSCGHGSANGMPRSAMRRGALTRTEAIAENHRRADWPPWRKRDRPWLERLIRCGFAALALQVFVERAWWWRGAAR